MVDLSSSTKKFGTAGLVLAVLIPFSFNISDIYVDPSDPGFGAKDFPRLIVWLGIALSCVLIWQAWNEKEAGSSSIPWAKYLADLKGPAITAALAMVYIWGITAFQYALPSVVLLISLIWFFGSRGFRDVVVVPIVAVSIYYLIFFVLFGIFEEPGTILQYDSYGFARWLRTLIGLQ